MLLAFRHQSHAAHLIMFPTGVPQVDGFVQTKQHADATMSKMDNHPLVILQIGACDDHEIRFQRDAQRWFNCTKAAPPSLFVLVDVHETDRSDTADGQWKLSPGLAEEECREMGIRAHYNHIFRCTEIEGFIM